MKIPIVQLRVEIEKDLNELLFKYQEKLGIKYGDTLLSVEPAVDNLVAILEDQYNNK